MALWGLLLSAAAAIASVSAALKDAKKTKTPTYMESFCFPAPLSRSSFCPSWQLAAWPFIQSSNGRISGPAVV